MKYPIEPREQKYIKGYSSLTFTKFGDKYWKKIMITAKKTVKNFGMDAAKFVSKIVTQNTAEVAGDLIGNKIVDQIISVAELKKDTTEHQQNNEVYKYRSEMPNQTKNNNLNYVIDPTFNKFNRLLALSFENENDRILYKNIICNC